MLNTIVSLSLIIIIIIDISYMIKKDKSYKSIIKAYEVNTKSIEELYRAIDKYIEVSEYEENSFEIKF